MRRNKHFETLDYITLHLDEILENPKKAIWVMKEGIWLQDGSICYNPFPDLIVAYDFFAVPVEVKATRKDKKRGIDQLVSGRRFIITKLRLPCDYGKIVYYGKRELYYDQIDLRKL